MNRWALLSLMALYASSAVHAALPNSCLPPPRPRVLLVDEADLLSEAEEMALQTELLKGLDSLGVSFVVVTHPTFCGLEPFEFATEVGDTWGVGRVGEDFGVVLAVRPRSEDADGQIFLATGRGTEGILTDAMSGRIIDRMRPFLAEAAWYEGLHTGTAAVFEVLEGKAISASGTGKQSPQLPWPAFILLVFVFIVAPAWAIVHGVRSTARVHHLPWWAAWGVFWAAQRHAGARFSHFSGGSGPFSGGGFSGFGGGRFGGGGAGGSF
jgi:uncharacterized protein